MTAPKYNDQAEFEEAKAAIAAFKKMCPQLTMYARSVTGQRVTVQPGVSSQTDGTTISIRPPLSLARPQVHERSLCNTFDDTNRSECPACRTRGELMTAVQHEIAHVAFGSFEKLNGAKMQSLDKSVSRYLPDAVSKEFSKTADAVADNLKSAPPSMVGAANTLPDDHIGFLYLFAEDMRINESSYRARTGLRKAMMAFERDVLENGIETDDGSRVLWGERPVDIQIAAALLFSVGGQNIQGFLDDEAVEVIRKTKSTWRQFAGAKDVYHTFELTAKILKDIRALGYMQFTEPPEPEGGDQGDEPEEDSESSDESESKSDGEGTGEDSESDSDGNGSGSGSSDESSDNSNPNGSGEGDDSKGDGSPGKSKSRRISATEEELEELLRELLGHAEDVASAAEDASSNEAQGPSSNQSNDQADDSAQDKLSKVVGSMWALDHIPRNISGIDVYEKGEGEAYSGGYYGNYLANSTPQHTPESVVGRAVMQARIAFGNNARVEHKRNQRVGRVASNVLGKRAALGDPRLFGRKIVPDKRNYHVLLGLDISYSTANGNIELIKQAVLALSDVCHRVGVEFSIYAHSSGTRETDGQFFSENEMTVAIWKVKDAKDRWDWKARSFVQQLAPVSGNLDGHTLQYYRKELDKVRATDKVLMYFTDGKMPASNYKEERMVLEDEIMQCRRRNYTLLGVGIGTDSPKEYGLDTVEVNGPDDYFSVVQHLSKRIIRTGV